MIALLDDDARISVDAAIERALSRLQRRAAPLGDGAKALTAATAAAAADGKRLRPALVVASYRAFGGGRDDDTTALWDVAAALELLHTAFVVHDDLIDRDLERRGIPNVAGRFRTRAQAFGAGPEQAAIVGDAAAVLAGDLLLFEAARLVACCDVDETTRHALLEIIDDAILVSASGELADVEHAARADYPDTDALLGAAHDKTAAYSFEAPLLAGAIMAGAPAEARSRLSLAAADLGLAFQLVDDLIGTFGSRSQAGRDPGADLREAKRTPLIALARDTAAWPRVSSALAVAHTGPIAVRRAQRELEASGARDHLVALIDDRLRRARSRSASPALPPAAVALLAEVANAIEGRIP
ncbi:polyprenyl synthetase family protein [Microbacterium hominis]|uniref:polyprenyl synthetase family protein n=1 Tax=Microbacterium hominis TaxID=162426 RepID=UPI00076860A6|nr:polyprenyl synthetase family protein [Microbacterium hominis]KXC05501.1 geranylgeranyl pyrophosphate synthase [Microbacterium hominis]